MPWTNAEADLRAALQDLPNGAQITVTQYEAVIEFTDDDPAQVQECLHRMFRAISKNAKNCGYGKGCKAWLHFMPSVKRDGTPTAIPVRSIREPGRIILRNHFRDCPGLVRKAAQAAPATPKADNPIGGSSGQQRAPERPKQAALFDFAKTQDYAD